MAISQKFPNRLFSSRLHLVKHISQIYDYQTIPQCYFLKPPAYSRAVCYTKNQSLYKQTLTLIQDIKVVSGGGQIHSWIWVNGQRP